MLQREIKFRAKTKNGNIIEVKTIKPKRRGAKGWYKVHGYLRRKVENHPYSDKRGYYPEHRLVMEKSIGRILEPTEFVHHKDQNRENNDLSNLELQGNQAKHMKDNKHLVGKRNPHGYYVANEPIFSELKFRLYDKDKKTTRIYTLATLIGTTFRRGGFEFRGRWTNLKDKNGKEIYEGDIVEITKNKDFNGIWVIILEKMPIYFRMNKDKVKGSISIGLKDYFHNYVWSGPSDNSWDKHMPEVIGNIYENKELLK